ncbi:hypothetical protein ABIF69_005888 [Bradyrhizobium japonicum]
MSDAAERIETFRRAHGERGELLLDLASHAALPVVIDAALLHLVRVNYFLDPPYSLPYTAEAELLLSPLCREIADGLYLMGAQERDILLRRLIERRGFARLKEVAGLLWEYGERHPPWAMRPGLAEAQQLTAMNFLHPLGAAAWLAQAETEARLGAPLDERWLVAMRQEITERTTAVNSGKESEKQVIEESADQMDDLGETTPQELPALEDLQDTLTRLYDFPEGVLGLAERAGVPLGLRGVPMRSGPVWRVLLKSAWNANRISGVLGIALSDYPENPYLKEALIDYWVRLTPALRVENGTFEPASPEWSALETHRAEIGTAIRAMCLFAVEGARAPGMGFMIEARTLLTHPSMAEGLKDEDVLWLAFADTHSAWPVEFKAHLGMPPRGYDVKRVRVERVISNDKVSFCAIIFRADDAEGLPPPLGLWTFPSEALVGRKVYTLGYPQATPTRVDPKIIERIIGSANEVLRLQPGEVTAYGGEPPEITHNCFTLVGNGGSPLVDLETGRVLGLHYAGAYNPGPTGLKTSKAIPILRILEAMRETESDRETTGTTADGFPEERLAEAAQAVCTIHLGQGRTLVGSGFLVGPDLVLTAYHVIRSAIETGRVSDLRCRFGEREAGNVCAVDAVIAFSPLVEDRPPLIAAGRLDYALLRLTFPVGNRLGWLPVVASRPAPVAGGPLRVSTRVLGHKVDLRGHVRGTDETGTTVRYTIGSRFTGSSGSPCFDADLNVVAMHQSVVNQETGRRLEAQGVLVSAIARDLADNAILLESDRFGKSTRNAHGSITIVWGREESLRHTEGSAFSHCFADVLWDVGHMGEKETQRITWAQIIDQTTDRLRREGIKERPDVKFLGAGMLDFPLMARTQRRWYRALVMAANRLNEPLFPPLVQAEEQAQIVERALMAAGFETTLLLGSQMTRTAVSEALRPKGASRNHEVLLVYFAGYGAVFSDSPEDFALVLHDTRASDPGSMIPLHALTQQRTEHQAVIVIVDIGHTGALNLPRFPSLGPNTNPFNTVGVGAGPHKAKRGSAKPNTKSKAKSAKQKQKSNAKSTAKPKSTAKATLRVKKKKAKKK